MARAGPWLVSIVLQAVIACSVAHATWLGQSVDSSSSQSKSTPVALYFAMMAVCGIVVAVGLSGVKSRRMRIMNLALYPVSAFVGVVCVASRRSFTRRTIGG